VALASDVIQLTPTNFDDEIGGEAPALVEFYAPWCGHCKQLAPEYDILGTTFAGSGVKIAQVDADKHKSLGQKFGVSGFPTIKYFPANSKTAENYEGGRTVADFTDFLNKKAGTNVRIKTAPTSVVILDDSNFDDIVKDETKDVLVEFYAPWCGHCKQLAPKYEQVGASFLGEPDVVIAKFDADAHKVKPGEYGVSGYPTLKFFPKNNKGGEDYTAGREVADFVGFINQKSGTERTPGGGYTEKAGCIPEFDDLVTEFMSQKSSRSKILKQLQDKLSSIDHPNKQYAKFYEIGMTRTIKEEDYGKNEATRLQRILDSGSVNVNKRGDMYRRKNIANLFKL